MMKSRLRKLRNIVLEYLIIKVKTSYQNEIIYVIYIYKYVHLYSKYPSILYRIHVLYIKFSLHVECKKIRLVILWDARNRRIPQVPSSNQLKLLMCCFVTVNFPTSRDV